MMLAAPSRECHTAQRAGTAAASPTPACQPASLVLLVRQVSTYLHCLPQRSLLAHEAAPTPPSTTPPAPPAEPACCVRPDRLLSLPTSSAGGAWSHQMTLRTNARENAYSSPAAGAQASNVGLPRPPTILWQGPTHAAPRSMQQHDFPGSASASYL